MRPSAEGPRKPDFRLTRAVPPRYAFRQRREPPGPHPARTSSARVQDRTREAESCQQNQEEVKPHPDQNPENLAAPYLRRARPKEGA